ncbi:glycosyltransferase [Sphingobacterium corticibacterium]|uniref:Glycosyltransferase n=1 Tax=Sphingobacterium corticibacterium TaxID=2484746 RepID=A0A4V2DBW8_9SPHI|nr:glycosyltransferase family 2 protein [Sphingobacterium corticibacterium]RZF59438.1 glycosyltransferase [Sphingobacterium corticibacterium]
MSFFILLLEEVLFAVFMIWVLYLLIFSIGSKIPKYTFYPTSLQKHRYLVVFPAYREDNVILESISTFKKQDYPSSMYEIVVVSDQMDDATNTALLDMDVTVLFPDYINRSKAEAMKLAAAYSMDKTFDAMVILDADNWVHADFLTKIDRAFSTGLKSIQAHRIAKNSNTTMAYLDGISEEINNSIFRLGQVNIGLPSALIGSGMVFDINWFNSKIHKVHSMGEDKELEYHLLEDRIFTAYLPDVYVLDEKVQHKNDFLNQRQRWNAAQVERFTYTFQRFISVLQSKNWPLFVKLIQWSIPPRIVLLGAIPITAILLLFIFPALAYKWIGLYVAYLIALLIALPNRFYNKRSLMALFRLPAIFITILRSLIKSRTAKNTFIHTPHGEKTENNRR